MRRIVLEEEQIARRVRALGTEITEAYPEGDLLVLGLLKGSFIFLSDLVREIHRPLQVDFVVAASYGDAMESSGTVRLVYDPETELSGKHILLVEDIVDTGLTLSYLREQLRSRHPASVKVAALLHKPARMQREVAIDFLGFTIDDVFVVGYGLDYAERYRNLPFLGVLDPSGISAG